MSNPIVAVVVPTNRPERCKRFLAAFKEQFQRHDAAVIVVEDADECTFNDGDLHVSRSEIKKHLGEKAECIAFRGAAIRSYGWLLAYPEFSADVIVNLDDDVLPVEGVDVIQGHLDALALEVPTGWFYTAPFDVRGTPYDLPKRQVMFNHGLWLGDPDLDAYQRLYQGETRQWPNSSVLGMTTIVPKGQVLAICGMNTAIRTSWAKYYWQPKLPDGMRRWDDIWSGLVLKRVCDLADVNLTSGRPFVLHERASQVIGCLRQEMLGYGINERIWRDVGTFGSPCDPPWGYERDLWQRAVIRPTSDQNFAAIWEGIGRIHPELAETARLANVWLSLWE